MRLLLIVLALLIAAGVSAHRVGNPRRSALACSIVPTTLNDSVAAAAFVGVVEVVRTGDGINHAPTHTATPTAEIHGATITPTWTPVRRGFDFDKLTPTATQTPTVTPSPPSFAYPDLAGRGADVVVIEELQGVGASTFGIDWDSRSLLEQVLREAEVGRFPLCGFGGLPEYRVGQRYFLVARGQPGFHLATVASYRIERDQALFGTYEGDGTLSLNAFLASTYERYLSDYPATLWEAYDGRVFAYVEVDALRLDRMRALFSAMAAPHSVGVADAIYPPETGNAGLKASH